SVSTAALSATRIGQLSEDGDTKYALVRTLGQILGIGSSQLNLDMLTALPHPTADDKAGFPLMHPPRLAHARSERCSPMGRSGLGKAIDTLYGVVGLRLPVPRQ